VTPGILALARREAEIVDVGKEGFGHQTAQAEIDALLVARARAGAQVVRLKSGDPTVFGRLDDELEAVAAAGIGWSVVPGITAASAAVAAIGQSLTRRGRNTAVPLLTGHDMRGFADHDWARLARPGEVAAIYMGKRAARFIQGRLLMHGAHPATPVTVVENASRPEERVLSVPLAELEPALSAAGMAGPAVILLGLAPRRSAAAGAPDAAAPLREAL
jgi:uroporphyrin-III C-methyltransferase/precorrin-2 dehydrogenase/sirohydrochlorin ferrochelatase